jgi:hypothetical protein
MQKGDKVFIVIAGKKQVGKDTLARFMKKALKQHRRNNGHQVDVRPSMKIVKFADPIKRFMTSTLDLPQPVNFDDNDYKNQPTKYCVADMAKTTQDAYLKLYPDANINESFLTVRDIMQILGTDVIRNHFYDNIFAEYPFVVDYSGDFYNGQNDVLVVAVPDGRFMTELATAHKFKSVLVKVVRETGLDDMHTSETELDVIPDDTYDYIIDNNFSLSELNSNAVKVLSLEGLISC